MHEDSGSFAIRMYELAIANARKREDELTSKRNDGESLDEFMKRTHLEQNPDCQYGGKPHFVPPSFGQVGFYACNPPDDLENKSRVELKDIPLVGARTYENVHHYDKPDDEVLTAEQSRNMTKANEPQDGSQDIPVVSAILALNNCAGELGMLLAERMRGQVRHLPRARIAEILQGIETEVGNIRGELLL